MSGLEQCRADLRRAVARIEWLEKWFAPKIYECCGFPAAGEHSSTCPLYGTPDERRYEVRVEHILDAWIEREFIFHGVAIREHSDPPIPGEPFMSMAVAKELTRRAVAEFSRREGRSFDKMVGDAVRKIDAEWNE